MARACCDGEEVGRGASPQLDRLAPDVGLSLTPEAGRETTRDVDVGEAAAEADECSR